MFNHQNDQYTPVEQSPSSRAVQVFSRIHSNKTAV